jgi:hypothetical protein
LLVGLSGVALPVVAQESLSIAVTELTHASGSIGASPEDIFARYGRPAKVEQPGLLDSFGVLGDKQITLIQYYDVDGGGRLAFLFRGQYRVAGIGFDNLRSSRYLSLTDFFRSVPRTAVLESCIQRDAFHHMPGDEYDFGTVPYTTMVATATRAWATPSGGLFFARYRLDGNERKVYDPVSGKDRIMPPRAVDNLKLLQFAWLPIAGRNEISDAHPGPDADLSTITIPYPETPCYSGTGAPIR